jgi:hypothetical protein
LTPASSHYYRVSRPVLEAAHAAVHELPGTPDDVAAWIDVTLLSAFTRPDEEIRREITQDVIADGFFTDPALFTVTVKDGIVTLAGAPGSVIIGRNIADQVRHVEGVVAVRDRFTYPALAARSASPAPSDPGF